MRYASSKFNALERDRDRERRSRRFYAKSATSRPSAWFSTPCISLFFRKTLSRASDSTVRALYTRGERERVSKRTWMVARDERVRCTNISTPEVLGIANFERRRGQRNFGHSHSRDGVEWTNGERPRGVKRVRRPEAARRSFKRRGFC